MSDREAFIAAIAANPAEDTPRLVFADWLEEHGEAARAGFIRDQVRLAHVRPGTEEYRQLYRRTAETLKANLPAWIQSACDAFGQKAEWKPQKSNSRWLTVELVNGMLSGSACNHFTFERGFIQALTINSESIRSADTIPRVFAEHPVTRLLFTHLTSEGWRLIECDALRQVRQLQFWVTKTPALFAGVMASPRWQALRILHLMSTNAENLTAVCRSPVARKLQQLKVPLGPGHLQALREYPLDDRLQELILTPSHPLNFGEPTSLISDIPELNALPFRPTLKRLDLFGHFMQDSGLAAFARGEVWLRLRSLVLDRNNIGDSGWRDFVRGRRTPELRMLSAAHNFIGNDGATRLAQSSLIEKLEYIDLRHNRISGNGALALARVLAESPLKKLLLTGNPINKTDAATIRKLLGNRVD